MTGWTGPRRTVGKILLAAWGLGTSAVLALLMVNHQVAMPTPSPGVRLMDTLRSLQTPGSTLVVHIVYARCSCTEDLLEHLRERGPQPGMREHVILVDGGQQHRDPMRSADYSFEVITAPELGARFGAEAAPLLMVMPPGGQLAYLGGYYDHPATVHPLDLDVFQAVKQGRVHPPLPLYGCAVSQRLRDYTDPLGLQP